MLLESSDSVVTKKDKLAVGYALGVASVFFGVSVLIDALKHDEWDPITARPVDVAGAYFRHNYTMPWFRAQTYIVGVACGYVMHLYRNKEGPKIPMVRINA